MQNYHTDRHIWWFVHNQQQAASIKFSFRKYDGFANYFIHKKSKRIPDIFSSK